MPLPAVVVTALQGLKDRAIWTDPEDLIFCGPRRGSPIAIFNLERRILKPAVLKLGFPQASWHSLRRAWANAADTLEFATSDVVAGMGHGDYAMSLRYTSANVERRRAGIDEMAALLAGAEPLAQAGIQAGIQPLSGRSGRRPNTTQHRQP